jgi:hypothetical protein
MTDFDKLTAVFTEIGIGYCVEGKDIKLNDFDIDGVNADVYIKFYENGRYQEFSVYPK